MCKEHAPSGETQPHVHTCQDHEHDGTFLAGIEDGQERKPMTAPVDRVLRPGRTWNR
jgi:hypothetical protein